MTTTTGISGAGNLSNAKFAAPMSAVEKNLAGVLIKGAITADTTSTLVVN